jgi:hypothetical protein
LTIIGAEEDLNGKDLREKINIFREMEVFRYINREGGLGEIDSIPAFL